MSEKIYLIFLILCGILLERIAGSFLEDNHNNSSNIHFRTKRMIGYTSFRDNEWVTTNAIHIAKVLQNDAKICAGVIVSPHYILTPEKCVSERGARYTVESCAPNGSMKTHRVEDILDGGDLALLLIKPPIIVTSSSPNRPVQLTRATLSTRMHTSILAWDPTGQLRSISPVPMANMLECGHQYISYEYPITENNICTLQLYERNHCSKDDIGSALVVNNILFGVLFRAGCVLGPRVPDVFIRVNGNAYYNWIKETI